jgi:integrase/recombinase XerD
MIRRRVELSTDQYKELLETYRQHLSHLGYHQSTQRMMYFNLLDFLQWLEQKELKEISKVKPSHIKAYHQYLKNRPHSRKEGVISSKTIHHHICSIRLFFALLQQTDLLEVNPMSVLKFTYPKETARPRAILTIEQIHALYRCCQTLQERAVLSLAYGCGLRSMEVAALDVEDVRMNDLLLVVAHGKGDKRRVIPINTRVKNDLQQYMELERVCYLKEKEDKAFLLNTTGERIRKWTLNKILKELLARTFPSWDEARRGGITLHSLRHSIATHLLQQGLEVQQVRMFLGHSQLETTEIYTHVNNRQLKKLIQ